jgi:hypothetical protein
MEIQNFTEVLSAILEVEQPLILTKIDFQPKNKVVEVFIDYSQGSKFLCYQSEELCPVHDSEVRRIRYLDLFEYQNYLNIRILISFL